MPYPTVIGICWSGHARLWRTSSTTYFLPFFLFISIKITSYKFTGLINNTPTLQYFTILLKQYTGAIKAQKCIKCSQNQFRCNKKPLRANQRRYLVFWSANEKNRYLVVRFSLFICPMKFAPSFLFFLRLAL